MNCRRQETRATVVTPNTTSMGRYSGRVMLVRVACDISPSESQIRVAMAAGRWWRNISCERPSGALNRACDTVLWACHNGMLPAGLDLLKNLKAFHDDDRTLAEDRR
jgi:hypothetical protein